MSSALAIASVTHVLKDLLNDGLINRNVNTSVNGSVEVTALPPDRVNTDSERSQLNLFMYLVTPNPGWRNHHLPSRNAQGDHISNPPLALDLHYLLTAYGAEELHHDILLGYGMQLLHETPVLARDAIRRSLTPPVDMVGGQLSSELQALSTSALADQVELIKITPEILNTEEVARLWTAFGAKYRPHAAYKATVVLIESSQSTRAALPVRQRNIYVRPFHRPVIEKISSRVAAGMPIVDNEKILSGHHLVINGLQLRGEVTSVNVGGLEVGEAGFHTLTDHQIIFTLPDALPAGIHGVQVVHQMLMGSPLSLHQGISSNVSAFVLSPQVIPITVTPVSGSGNATRTVDLELDVKPLIRPSQRFLVLLNEINLLPGTPPQAYSFEIPVTSLSSPASPVENFTVRLEGIKAGAYVLRIQVDGAESPLKISGTSGYDTPSLTIV